MKHDHDSEDSVDPENDPRELEPWHIIIAKLLGYINSNLVHFLLHRPLLHVQLLHPLLHLWRQFPVRQFVMLVLFEL